MGEGRGKYKFCWKIYTPAVGRGAIIGQRTTHVTTPITGSSVWLQGPAASNVTDRVYGVIDLYGQAAQVNGGIKPCNI